MYHDIPRAKTHGRALRRLAAALAAAALLYGGAQGYRHTRAALQEQAVTALHRAIQNAAIQCYAVEGAYPESLEYLQSAYGLRINSDRFLVRYSAFASNLLPDIVVLPK